MIYLIAGPPRCGKTIVAKKLAEELSIPWISTDTLESVISAYVPAKDYEEKFPKAVMRKKTNNSNDEMYSKFTAEEIVSAYRQQAETLSEALKLFVETIAKDGESYIVEGHHLSPNLISSLQESYADQVKAVVLTRSDPAVIEQSARKFAKGKDWFTKKTKNEETYPKIAAMIKLYGEQIEKEATQLGITVINMDEDFTDRIEKALDHLRSS